jgi:hypothetical protein
MAWTEAQKRYARSQKGIQARKKYQSSEKAKLARQRYMTQWKMKLAEAKQTQMGSVPAEPVKNKPETSKIKKEVRLKK